MISYLAAFINTDGVVFPNTKAINSSGPSTTDGTEFVKIMVDDEWGARQALLDYAGLTPNTVTEGPGASQALEAMQKGLAVGPGFGVTYWKDGDPATNGDRVLLLQGQGVLRASYTELDTAVYVGDPDNPTASAFYHADDAAGTIRNTTGVYLILPDLRGYVLRGLDTAASVDPDGASRDLGSIQVDAMQRITGSFETDLHASGTNSLLSNHAGVFTIGPSDAANFPASGSSYSRTDGALFDNTNSTSPNAAKTDDVESRMVNIATNYGITY